MAIPIEEWYYEVPIITRTYVTAAFLTSLAVQVGLVNPFQLYFNFDKIFYDRQYWRLVTNFLYFGPFSLDFLYHMFFLTRYSRMLEEGSFRGRTADYFWLLFLSAFALILLSPLSNMPFLGSPLAFALVYIWSRRNPFIRLNFVGLFVFSAPFLPWVLLGFSLLLNNVFPTGDMMGIAVGHVYYFFEDVWPNERNSGGRRWLKTPQIIVRMFEGIQNDPRTEPIEVDAAEPMANPPANPNPDVVHLENE
ncbi:hypothetical protein Glove_8g40 [Diversispora epigaea]|uniref:Derlin n=1 Tax=Diversispora epigaea TaxID=1348612 RepID=A0A397K005_9GLOM|nr:hypothetical protein Glove_8g40 [Diversispora epigaea]